MPATAALTHASVIEPEVRPVVLAVLYTVPLVGVKTVLTRYRSVPFHDRLLSGLLAIRPRLAPTSVCLEDDRTAEQGALS